MATTSSNLTTGTASTGQRGTGQGQKARAAGLVATAALGLGLLAGGLLGQAHHAGAPAAARGAQPAAPRVSVALGDRDDPRFTGPQLAAPAPHAVIALGDRDDPRFAGVSDHGWALADGTRPGLLETLPGEDPTAPPAETRPSFGPQP